MPVDTLSLQSQCWLTLPAVTHTLVRLLTLRDWVVLQRFLSKQVTLELKHNNVAFQLSDREQLMHVLYYMLEPWGLCSLQRETVLNNCTIQRIDCTRHWSSYQYVLSNDMHFALSLQYCDEVLVQQLTENLFIIRNPMEDELMLICTTTHVLFCNVSNTMIARLKHVQQVVPDHATVYVITIGQCVYPLVAHFCPRGYRLVKGVLPVELQAINYVHVRCCKVLLKMTIELLHNVGVEKLAYVIRKHILYLHELLQAWQQLHW